MKQLVAALEALYVCGVLALLLSFAMIGMRLWLGHR